jgi:hypothetical protein
MADPLAPPAGINQPRGQPASELDRLVNLFQQALQQGVQLGSSSGRGPGLRDLPKDAFKLPTFKGNLTGADRVRPSDVLTFLNRLEKYMNVYRSVISSDDARLDVIISCFPEKSRAATWYNTQRKRLSTPAEFRQSFIDYFGGDASEDRTLRSRLLSFRQRDQDSVTDYYAAFCQLVDDIHALAEFLHSGQDSFLYDDYTQADMFVHGLKYPVREEVERIQIRNPDFTLEDLFREAVLEEKHAKRKRKAKPVPPTFNALDHKTKWCYFCKGKHDPKDCPKIAAKKAKGTWADKPPKRS